MERHVKRNWLACAFALLIALPCHAQEAAGLSGSVPAGVVRETLGNGLRVVIVPDSLAPVVTTQLSYLAGSNDAPAGFPGTAHALEHMMFRGSAGLDQDQAAELSALLGGSYNANTTETMTRYFYTVPAVDLPLVLHAEALRMAGLTLAQADWEKERGAIEQEVSRDLSSPFYTYIMQAQALLFQGTPYEHDALGTRPSFDKTDAALLRQFYERWYVPNNAVLVVAGDVQPEQALQQVRQAFGAIPRREVPAHPAITLSPVQPATIELPTDLPVGLVSLAYRMPGERSADFATADILGDVLASRRYALFGLVPAGKALSARFNYDSKADVGFGLALAAFPKGSDPAPLLAELRGVLSDAAEHGVPAELVEAAKRQELAQLAFENDSIGGLASSWTEAVAFAGRNSPEDLAQAYAAVTPEGVNRLARELLDPAHAITAVLTPTNANRPAGSGFGGAESFNSPPDHAVVLPGWATAALTPPDPASVPPSEPPTITVLPNGLRLIVQPEHVSHTVSVYGRVREVAATEEPPGKEGVASLTRDLFGYGTERLDRLAFQKAVDDLGAFENAGAAFSLRVLTPQFEPGMRLLAEHELHPAFPEAAFTVLRRQHAQSLAGLLQSPDYLFGRAETEATVPPGDASLRQATPGTVEALTVDDVRAYYAAAYRPDLVTIVAVGDVTPEHAQEVVTAAFGDWQAAGPAPAIDLPPIPLSTASSLHLADEERQQDRVLLAESVAVPVTSPDRYKLLLGNAILGDGFSSRLYRDLRITTGYVYSVSSHFTWSRSRAGYDVSFGADGVNVPKARALVLRDIQAMQETPVSDADLGRAKAELARRVAMQRASVGAIAALYLGRSEFDLPIETPAVAAAHYLPITAGDIQQAFATWVRPEDLAQIVLGPPAP